MESVTSSAAVAAPREGARDHMKSGLQPAGAPTAAASTNMSIVNFSFWSLTQRNPSGLRSGAMTLSQAPSRTPYSIRFAPGAAEKEVALRTQLTNARFHRLLDYCAGVLGESVRATDDLSRRVRSLRNGIESQTDGEGRCNNGERDR
jgi:hypothetical protein